MKLLKVLCLCAVLCVSIASAQAENVAELEKAIDAHAAKMQAAMEALQASAAEMQALEDAAQAALDAPGKSTPSRAQSQSARNVAMPAKWNGKVTGVTDGNTVTVMYGSTPVRIQLYGIDAPESNQAFGSVAKQKLSELAFGKTLAVTKTGTDQYGRVLAWLHLGKTNINASMVRSGYAWHHKQYAAKETQLAQYQALARKEKRGLWRDAKPVAPWDFRR